MSEVCDIILVMVGKGSNMAGSKSGCVTVMKIYLPCLVASLDQQQ
jgi:hypothetical protein